MSSASLEIVDNEIGILTLQRPEKRNALDIPLLREILKKLEVINNFSTIRVLILRGAGKVFCAGLDLEEMQIKEATESSSSLIKSLFSTLYETPCITIAAVQGGAIAGGAGLAFASDFILSTPDAVFGFPEVRRGIVPAFVTALLKRQMNEREVKAWLLTGEFLSAQQMWDRGWLYRLAAEDSLLDESLDLAKKILQGGPHAIRHTKAFWQTLSSSSLTQDLTEAEAIHQKGRLSTEAEEGLRAFLEKRPPIWAPKPTKEAP